LEKCVGCHYYDRNDANVEDKGVRWGKCRRSVPMLHPVSAKAYMVEGIWPHVRDDDWCGEWVAIRRKADKAMPDPRNLMVTTPATPIRTAGMPAGSLMTPVPGAAPPTPAAGSGEAPAPFTGRFGSD
jgi:hypothetical protein